MHHLEASAGLPALRAFRGLDLGRRCRNGGAAGLSSRGHLVSEYPRAAPAGEVAGLGDDVSEAPWSVAEWAVALRFDNPRATVRVLVLG